MDLVYIVVLNWNGYKDTIFCLESLAKLAYKNYKILVCDNASTDGSVDKINAWLKHISKKNKHFSDRCKILVSERNLGFSAGNNRGLRYALEAPEMRYCWILNNDTEVDVNALSALVDRMKNKPQMGICGSKLIYFHDRNKLQALGARFFPVTGGTSHIMVNQSPAHHYDQEKIEKEMDYVVGASMLVSKNFLESVGLLNERFFLYFEELDWAFRAKGKFGIGLATDSIVYHKEGGTIRNGKKKSRTEILHSNRSLLVFYNLHCRKLLPLMWLKVFVKFLLASILAKPEKKQLWQALINYRKI